MEQTPIKLRADQPQRFEVAEVDANWKELDDRTKYEDEELNSMHLQGEAIKNLQTSKLPTGGFQGTAQDLKDQLDAIAGGSQGAIAIADTPTEIGYYYPTESGTYTNAGGLVVDLTDGITILIYDGTNWGMQVVPVDFGIILDGGESTESHLFDLTSYYYYTTGNVAPVPYGHTRTSKFILPAGHTLEYGINTYTSLGSGGYLLVFNLDGTFNRAILKGTEMPLNTFLEGTYTALVDEMVALSDYTAGNYGIAYAEINRTYKGLYELTSEINVHEIRISNLEDATALDDLISDSEANEMFHRGSAFKNMELVKKYGIIVAGQSNADGRVPLAEVPAYIIDGVVPNVQMFRRTEKDFQPFVIGVNGGGQAGASTLWAFDAIASYLIAQDLGESVYLIKNTRGGTAIDITGTNGGGYWTPKTENITTGIKLVEILKDRVLDALENYPELEIKAVMWHQGEGDSTVAAAPLYYQNFKNVIAYIRGIVKNPKLPFVFGTISETSAQYNPLVNAAQQQIAAEDPFVFLVDMADGTLLDAYHFDAATTIDLGTQVADIINGL